jgi:probable O-glycosylation ligase (exosortase A-associated)
MRSLLLALLVFGSLPLIVVKPHVGVLVWSWLGYMNPHRLTWGFTHDFSFALVVGLVTAAAWLFSREPKRLPRHPLVLLLAAWALWVSFTTLFAAYPDEAHWKWDRTIKILLMNGLVTLGLITSRARLQALIWVIVLSLGFYALKGAAFTVAMGGNYRVWGPPGTFIADNNQLGMALLMTIPLVRYLQLQASRAWLRLGLLVLMLCFLLAAIGTYSRGAVVGLAVTALALLIKSRHRMKLAFVAGTALVGAIQFMPAHWHARVESILAYEDDPAVQGRFASWEYALKVAGEYPVMGGGFEVFRGNLADSQTGWRSAHSIYFEALAEHGYVGLAIFLALLVGTYLAAGAIVRRTRDQPELAWARDLAAMVQVSLAAYAVAGLFLNLATFDLFYHLVTIVVITHALVAARPTAQASPLPAATEPAHGRPEIAFTLRAPGAGADHASMR